VVAAAAGEAPAAPPVGSGWGLWHRHFPQASLGDVAGRSAVIKLRRHHGVDDGLRCRRDRGTGGGDILLPGSNTVPFPASVIEIP
jgi:hypothetical protein